MAHRPDAHLLGATRLNAGALSQGRRIRIRCFADGAIGLGPGQHRRGYPRQHLAVVLGDPEMSFLPQLRERRTRGSSAPAAAPRPAARRYRRCRSTDASARVRQQGRRPSRVRTAADPRPGPTMPRLRPSRKLPSSQRAISGRASSALSRCTRAQGRQLRGETRRTVEARAEERKHRGHRPGRARQRSEAEAVEARQRPPACRIGHRTHGADEGERRHPRRQARGNPGRIGPAARDAADGEVRVAQMIHQRRHVGGERRQRGRARRIAEAVAPAVRRDDGEAQPPAGLVGDGELQARARRAVQEEQGRARRVAPDAETRAPGRRRGAGPGRQPPRPSWPGSEVALEQQHGRLGCRRRRCGESRARDRGPARPSCWAAYRGICAGSRAGAPAPWRRAPACGRARCRARAGRT